MESDEPGIRFKAKKRTKTLRQRDRDPLPDTTITTTSIIPAAPDAPASDNDNNDNNSNEEAIDGADASSSVQAALKLRQSRTKHRFRGGVGFGRNEPAAHASSNDDTSLVLRDAATTVAQGLPDRFMHQTGFIADADDRHMTAYVESRLSSRRGASAEQQQQQQQQRKQHNLAVDDGSDKRTVDMRRKTNAPGTMQTGTSTTSWTKLVEVQVPADVGSSNNNNSKKRSLDAAETTKQNPPRRRRNRRGSDDMKRDAMVEAFLHENKRTLFFNAPSPPLPFLARNTNILPLLQVDVYDVSDASAAANDDTLAENFRQQYIQEVAARRQRRRPALNQPRQSQKQLAHQQAVAAGEVLKGPKLGGSRNARAAVRDALLQQQELRKKGK
ncbi:hypothetical protein BBO_06638 [Beauveria brongniartii RCEF 3172]|uniref:mRNA splicing factor RNA helicase n=1 Tax=Beauveria brongniartii RCEF 3172 TaxID=1081107 RepID=A0A169YF98_9HYPO|nr:hypothetical protein BBO_06638 [Beauveria brongniartii RCEF 3172]